MTDSTAAAGDGEAVVPPSSNPDENLDARLNRNWHDLLQELRVTQTGVQILTGFLLILPFSPGFSDLEQSRRVLYCVVLAAALSATFMVLTPVVLHRVLFREGEKAWLVHAADRAALVGSCVLGFALLGALWLIVDFVLSTALATGAVIVFVLALLGLWVALPARVRSRSD